jgi:hypothetical protein
MERAKGAAITTEAADLQLAAMRRLTVYFKTGIGEKWNESDCPLVAGFQPF